jgi:protein SCO1/2
VAAKRQRFSIIIAIALLALLFGIWFSKNTGMVHSNHQPETATVFNQPRLITPFNLTDDKGQPFTIDNLKGHWSLVFFGFTNCPDLCPTTLSTLNKTYQILAADHQNPMPQVIFISVDPERDSIERIQTYLKNFNPNFIGATGSKPELDKLTQELSVIYAKVMEEDHYMIDHSGTIILVNPQGQFYGVFTLPHDATNIAKDIKSIISSK